jgi:hypothetical protein
MPFTFSHPAIVLPLTYLPKRWFSLTGLIIGSMTPDFEYFLRMKIQSLYSHTINGLFWFDLPLGIILAFIFHLLVRNTLFGNLPYFINSRLSEYKSFQWTYYFKHHWLVVCISVLIGAASHLLWDSFTHQHGYFVAAIPQLTQKVTLLGKDVFLFKILQHGSTLIGTIVILYAFLKLPINQNTSKSINYKYWSIVSFLALLVIFLRMAFGLGFRQYGHLIATGIAAVMIGLVLAPLFLKNNIKNS